MKANELRIGNLIFENNKIKKIYSVSGENAKDYSKLTPIPLTEEWVKKLGFEECYRSKYHSTFEHPKFLFIGYTFGYTEHHETSFKYYGKHNVECKYVHQLQNLYFALTGHELQYAKAVGV